MSFVDRYFELRAAANDGELSDSSIGAWALEQITVLARHDNRMLIRDRLLCAAATHLTGSTYARAGKLRVEILALDRRHGALSPVRQLLTDALDIDPHLPRSHRQLYTIISETESEALPIAADSAGGLKP